MLINIDISHILWPEKKDTITHTGHLQKYLKWNISIFILVQAIKKICDEDKITNCENTSRQHRSTRLQWRHVDIMAFQTASNASVCWTICSGQKELKSTIDTSYPLLNLCWFDTKMTGGFLQKEPVMRNAFFCHDVIMSISGETLHQYLSIYDGCLRCEFADCIIDCEAHKYVWVNKFCI